MSDYKVIDKCRFCNSQDLKLVLDLGLMPSVNCLLDTPDQEHNLYPLKMFRCNNCTIFQLDTVVSPEILYSKYNFRSGMSMTFKNHCYHLAKKIELITKPESLIVDIASNDGTMLSMIDRKVLGVEPASNLCEIMNSINIPNINKFFNYETALDIATKQEADIIIAQNVFAHVDNIHDFLHGVYRLLKPKGTFIVEVPWSVPTINNASFGQVYHEHLSYITIQGMALFLNKFHMYINYTEYFSNIHDGTMRFWIKKGNKEWSETDHYLNPECINYDDFQSKVDKIKSDLLALVGNEKVSGVCASAKGNILMNYCGLADKVDCIYDSTPEKVGKYTPGTRTKILPFEEIANCKNKILILSPNWQDEVIKNVRMLNPNAKFITTNPTVKEI